MPSKFEEPNQISNEEVMTSIMELKEFIFDANINKKKSKRVEKDYSSSESRHRHKAYSRDKYRKRSRKMI